MSIKTLIGLLIVGLVLALIYYLVSLFVGGTILLIVGVILVLVFIARVLQAFGIV
jgi:hypothetical protein